MRIYNNENVCSVKNWLMMAIPFTLVLFAWLGIEYLFASTGFDNFFYWFFNAYKSLSSFKEFLVVYGFPIVWLCFIIISIYVKHQNTVKFNKKLNLKYVNFLPDRLEFCFNQPQYNFTCGYKDIEKLEMNIGQHATITGCGSTIIFHEIKLCFTVLNKKHFSLINRETRRNFKAIYAIIDAGRLVQKFVYKFLGIKDSDMEERIERFQEYGIQPILTSEMKFWFKNFSILFFAGGLIYWYYLLLESGMNVGVFPTFILPIIALVISFVADVFLILDKVNEKKHRGF